MRILVVDDEPMIRALLTRLLRESGHIVAEAANGAEAIAAIPTFGPEVMLLDLLMPVQDGFGVLRALRELRARPPRVIVLSAIANLREAAYARELGAEAVIAKPFDVEDLLQTIDRRRVPR